MDALAGSNLRSSCWRQRPHFGRRRSVWITAVPQSPAENEKVSRLTPRRPRLDTCPSTLALSRRLLRRRHRDRGSLRRRRGQEEALSIAKR
jgi:hypothetical protein